MEKENISCKLSNRSRNALDIIGFTAIEANNKNIDIIDAEGTHFRLSVSDCRAIGDAFSEIGSLAKLN